MRFFYYKCRPKDHPFPILAWLIMIFQGMAPWRKASTSHRALGYQDQNGMKWVVDSTGSHGVRLRYEPDFRDQYQVVSAQMFYIKNVDHFRLRTWIDSIIDIEYDQEQVWGLLAKRLFGFVTFNKHGKDWRSMICNEVILSLLTHFGMVDTQIRDPDNWDLLMTDQLIDTIIEGSTV